MKCLFNYKITIISENTNYVINTSAGSIEEAILAACSITGQPSLAIVKISRLRTI